MYLSQEKYKIHCITPVNKIKKIIGKCSLAGCTEGLYYRFNTFVRSSEHSNDAQHKYHAVLYHHPRVQFRRFGHNFEQGWKQQG